MPSNKWIMFQYIHMLITWIKFAPILGHLKGKSTAQTAHMGEVVAENTSSWSKLIQPPLDLNRT